MENSNHNNAPKETKALSAAHTLLDTVSYAASAVAGWVAGDLSVRASMYKNFASHGVFNDLQAGRKNGYRLLLKEIESGDKENVPHRVAQLETDYRNQVAVRFKELGINGIDDWWRTLKRNQKMDAIVSGVTVSGVSIGALMLVTNSREFSHMLDWTTRDKQHDERNLAPSL